MRVEGGLGFRFGNLLLGHEFAVGDHVDEFRRATHQLHLSPNNVLVNSTFSRVPQRFSLCQSCPRFVPDVRYKVLRLYWERHVKRIYGVYN